MPVYCKVYGLIIGFTVFIAMCLAGGWFIDGGIMPCGVIMP